MVDNRTNPYTDVWYSSDDGLRLYARRYACTGRARATILCMHGLTRNSADFAELCESLQDQYELIVADQRGRGLSAYDSTVTNYQPARYVKDMVTLLEELSIDQVILIGTSMGGLMAMAMGAAQPERFIGIVLNDIGPQVDPAGLQRIMSYAGKVPEVHNWDEAAAQAKATNGIAFPDYTNENWLHFAHRLYVVNDKGQPQLAYDPAIADAIEKSDTAAVPVDLWPVFSALSAIPTLIVRGATSDILAADCVARMLGVHSLCEAVEVSGRGHAPMLDEPKAAAAINGFLTRITH